VRALLALQRPADELLVVDQTYRYDPGIEAQLRDWDRAGAIRWRKRSEPSITAAMNDGLLATQGDLVLFLDDDIIPCAEIVAAHLAAAERHGDAWAFAGQVLQPEDTPMAVDYASRGGPLGRYLDFPFWCTQAGFVENVMAGNLCVRREQAILVGGFDENFTPPVAYRFETEFAKRVIAAGGRIWFEPKASIRHIRAPTGGTRSRGSHLTSLSPVHGVGDYYYALRCGSGWDRARYMLKRPFREVRTRFHLAHPWWIPAKLIGEMRAWVLAVRLSRRGPRYIATTASGRQKEAG